MTRDQLIDGLAQHIVEHMDTISLVQFVLDELSQHFKDCDLEELLDLAAWNGFKFGEVTA